MRSISEPGVSLTVGIDEEAQQANFANATLQGNGEKLAFSVATYITFATEYASPDELADAVLKVLRAMPRHPIPGVEVEFEVEVGHARNV